MNTISFGGNLTVNSGNYISNTTISSGGNLIVNSGNYVSNTTISSGGNLIVNSDGIVIETNICSGGNLIVNSRGTTFETSIYSGGNLTINSGGTTFETSIYSGGNLTINSGGSASETSIYSGGNLIILVEGWTFNTSIFSGANLTVNSGGSASETSIYSGGNLTINSGGIAYDTSICSGGNLTINLGGDAYETSICSGGNLVVSSGISVFDTTIFLGGNLMVNSGGNASKTSIFSDGRFVVSSGGSAVDTNISSGGNLVVSSGGSLNGATKLYDGATATIPPDAGGYIFLYGNTNGGLTISGLDSNNSSTVITTVIKDFDGGEAGNSDAIKLAGIQQNDVKAVEYKDTQGNENGDFVTLTLQNDHKIIMNIMDAEKTGYSLGLSNDGSLLFEVCFLAGSMIRILDGEIAVEDINVGDQVLTYDWKLNKEVLSKVRWVGSKAITVNPDLMDDEAGYPVRIVKDAIADGVPYKDLLITSEHSLFFKDKFIPVRMLVNGYSIYYDYTITDYTYYHIETEQHSVIWADGMLTESYLDTGNRSQFKQHGDVAVLTPKNSHKQWKNDAVAPLGVERNFVEPLHQKLTQRAMKMGLPMMQDQKQFTKDPELHLMTKEGLVINPTSIYKDQYTFLLPDEEIENIYLVSRASRKSDIVGAFIDNRHYFGVLVGNINILALDQFNGVTIDVLTEHLNQPTLDGWHGLEQTPSRWTNGKALLNIPQQHLKKRRLTIHVCSKRSYILQSKNKKSIAI